MWNFWAGVSVALQLYYGVALFCLGDGLIEMFRQIPSHDPRLVAGTLSSAVVSSLGATLPALIGLGLGIYLLSARGKAPEWFRRPARILSYFWLAFIPVGTVLGAWQLRCLRVTAP